MAALKTAHTPELRGLYANSNRFSQPQGTVPRLSNLYLTRRGAFHTVPGSLWVSSFDGTAPHVTNQLPIRRISWYSPSIGSSAGIYVTQFPQVTPFNFVVALQVTAGPGVALIDASAASFTQLASQAGAISLTPNMAQFSDYLILGFANNVPPNIFPTVTQVTVVVASGDSIIQVANTLPFANEGYIVIGTEIIGYTSKEPNSFTGLTRGAFGTTAAAHAVGVSVYLSSATGTPPITTTITNNMISSDASVNATSTTAFPVATLTFTPVVLIDSEAIGYGGSTATSFTGLIRGLGGTTAAAHTSGATVFSLAINTNGNAVNTAVTTAITAISVSVKVVSTANFTPAGYISIDAEVVKYTGRTPTSFTGLTRAQGGTTAAIHSIGAQVFQVIGGPSLTGQVWGPITNIFDPSLVYGQWPGSSKSPSSTDAAAANIGTIIYEIDGAGVAWLFRAQNSGVTAYGATYYSPQFWPFGLIYNDGVMTLASTNLTSAVGRFTAAMVGQPITVKGAGAAGDLLTTVASFTSATVIVLANPAATAVTAAVFSIGVGHYGDVVKDYNPVNKKGTEVWLNIGQAALSPPGAAFVFQHLDSIFLWGVGETYGVDGITGPDALWQSNTGSPLTYDPASATFVGKGDGTQAQGGAEYSLSEAGIAATPQLVLFKDASTYSFLNSFPNASLVEVSGGLGCIAPATIQFIGGYGVMRLSYAGVTLFDGQLEHVTEYTDAIRGYLFGGLSGVAPVDFTNIQSCVSTQSVNPPMYVFYAPLVGGSGNVTRAFGYDFGLKQWFVIDLPFAISAATFLPQSVVAIAAAYQSLAAGANDGTVRRFFAADPDWDGVPVDSSVQLPDWGFPGTPTFVRRCNAYIKTSGGGATPFIRSVTFQGVRRSGVAFSRPLNTPISLISSMDVGETVLSGNITLNIRGQVLLEGTDAQTSEKPTGRVGL